MQEAHTLKEKLAKQEALVALLAKRTTADQKFMSIAIAATGGDKEKAKSMITGKLESLGNADCHEQSLQAIVKDCGALDDYTMRYSRLFANLCSYLPTKQVEDAVASVCNGGKTDLVV